MGFIFWTLALSPLLWLLWKYIHRKFDYFEERGLPYLKPHPIFGSHLKLFLQMEPQTEISIRALNQFRTEKFVGFFDMLEPALLIQHPDLVKQVAIKDFDHFANHVEFTGGNTDDALFSESVFLMRDQKWKDMRATLSPAFTGSKMRMMFELVRDCAVNATTFLKEKSTMSKNEITEIEAKEVFSQITVDVISSCAFGLQVDSLRDPKNQVFEMIKLVFTSFSGFISIVKFMIFAMIPSVGKALNLTITPREATFFFKKLIADTISHRKHTNTFRPDVIQLLMQAMEGNLTHDNDTKEEDTGFAVVQESEIDKKTTRRNWNEVEVAAQCFIFFTAGYETTSSLLTFLSYELAMNQDVQNKLFEEILEAKKSLNGSPVTYEVIQKMQYMDAVITEGLRKHPPVPQIDRICNKDTLLDDGNGKAIMVPNKMSVLISIYGLHYNPKYYPNPERFDPERYLGDNKQKIVPNTFLPFGVGPRACIGNRFALMQAKLIVYYILSEFSFEVCDKTLVPLRYSKNFRMEPEGGLIIGLKKR